MTLTVADETGEQDTENYVDIKHDDDYLVSVDAHDGKPPKISVFEPNRPEDALATFKMNEDGDLESWDM